MNRTDHSHLLSARKKFEDHKKLLFQKCAEEEGEENLETNYVLDLLNQMKRCQDMAIERMTVTRDDQKKMWHDGDAVERTFKIEGKVLVLVFSKPNKLSVN